jgi:hypothetical protein
MGSKCIDPRFLDLGTLWRWEPEYCYFLRIYNYNLIYMSERFLNMLGPGVYSASNGSEYQKHKNNHVSGE